MDEYTVTFVHPTTGATLTAAINPNLTADEVVNALVSENFITPAEPGFHYELGVNGGSKVGGSQSLASSGLRDGGTVNIAMTGEAGFDMN